MKRYVLALGLFLLLASATVAWATLEEIKTETQPATDYQTTVAPTTNAPAATTPTTTTRTSNPNQTRSANPSIAQMEKFFTDFQKEFQGLQKRLESLEKPAEALGLDPRLGNWLNGWWQIGFWVGLLWLLPWIFVGWQWARLKFWGFGWPWPWWFWLPLLWYIPWLWLAWQWWLIWWVWWIWIWWLWPWVFWLFWWIVVFKELNVSQWHRRGPDYQETR